MSKPSHATGTLEGTRMEQVYGRTHYYCPCGQIFTDLKSIRRHVSGKYKREMLNCRLGAKGYKQATVA